MRGPKEIAKGGYNVPDWDGDFTILAMLSLKLGLIAYFSTYQALGGQLHLFDPEVEAKFGRERLNAYHGDDYLSAYAETILHFHHFAELVSKDVLRSDHPLLVVDATERPLLLHRLLRSEKLDSVEWEGLETIGFRDALTRLTALVGQERIKGQAAFSIAGAGGVLGVLNTLRNRVAHKGTFALRYPALDDLISGHVLPFVRKFSEIPSSISQETWKYAPLACGIDPIDALIQEASESTPNLRKMAFLKELGRAAYQNRLQQTGWLVEHLNATLQRRAEGIAAAEEGEVNVARVTLCPVCGLRSLVVFEDTEIEFEGSDDEIGVAYDFTVEVRCMNCTFLVHRSIGNPSEHDLLIEDYWQTSERTVPGAES